MINNHFKYFFLFIFIQYLLFANNPLQENADDILNQLTVDEKISLLSGKGVYNTQNIDRLGLIQLELWDGPNGVRSNSNEIATAFPVGISMGATWNTDLINELGLALGKESRAFEVEVLLGPTMNIIRTPLNGRTFETFSEDPFFNGVIASAYINGLQSEYVGASVKHFIANNQEIKRQSVSAEISERALREIYLPAFEKVVKESQPYTIMAAYNRINGIHATEQRYIMNDILRGEFGFEGVLLSDWGGVKSTAPSLKASLDLEMPGPGNYYEKPLRKALKKGVVTEQEIDEAALRMIKLILKTKLGKNYEISEVLNNNKEIARLVAEESIVLLKNKKKTLPLNPKNIKSIAVIGPNANRSVIQGGGSARVTPAYSITPLKGILDGAQINDIDVYYEKGVENHPTVPLMERNSLRTKVGSENKGLRAEYYRSYDLSGDPYKVETDEELRIFGILDKDIFGSVKWTGEFIAQNDGQYRFSANPGLGKAKIYIDEKKLSLNEKGRPGFGGLLPAPRIGNVFLNAGKHLIRIEYSAKPNVIIAFILKIIMPAMSNMLNKFRYLEIGCRLPEPSISDAVDLAKKTDVAIVVVGSSDNYETEGEDRPSMKLTGEQDKLIESILNVNKNTIVIMNTGSPIEMPWIEQCPAVLQVWLPGQENGNALSNVLFGNVNPSGKLPVTFPKRIEDNPSFGYYPGEDKVIYNEGIYVGYRHYDTRNVEPLFPFGHGLSYTEFEYKELDCPREVQSLDKIELNFSVKNIGEIKGQEVVQCYVRDISSSLDRPLKELKAFHKVSLFPGESKTVNLSLDKSSFSFFDDRINKWIAEPGNFEILIGSSSKDIRLKQIINYNN